MVTDNMQWLAARRRKFCRAFPILKQLRKRLLAGGGEEVVINALSDEEMRLQAILAGVVLQHGTLFAGRGAKFIRGERSNCHANAYWLAHDGKASNVGQGWALSEDGLWRFHSWGVTTDGKVIETTEKREKYFGISVPWEVLNGGKTRRRQQKSPKRKPKRKTIAGA